MWENVTIYDVSSNKFVPNDVNMLKTLVKNKANYKLSLQKKYPQKILDHFFKNQRTTDC